MAAPMGNQFGWARSSYDRDPKFDRTGALWGACQHAIQLVRRFAYHL